MSDSKSSLPVFLTTGLSSILLITTIVGWVKLSSTRRELRRCSARPACREDPPEGPDTQRSKPLRKAPPGPLFDPRPDKATSPATTACLKDPAVQRHIAQRAMVLASSLSDAKLEDYKDDQKSRRLERRQKRMERFETGAVNAVNRYIDEFKVDEQTGKKLNAIFEEGSKKGKKLFQQMQEGTITRREFWQQSRAAREEGATAVANLIGEDNAQELWRILGEEMQKEWEKAMKAEEAKSKTATPR